MCHCLFVARMASALQTPNAGGPGLLYCCLLAPRLTFSSVLRRHGEPSQARWRQSGIALRAEARRAFPAVRGWPFAMAPPYRVLIDILLRITEARRAFHRPRWRQSCIALRAEARRACPAPRVAFCCGPISRPNWHSPPLGARRAFCFGPVVSILALPSVGGAAHLAQCRYYYI